MSLSSPSLSPFLLSLFPSSSLLTSSSIPIHSSLFPLFLPHIPCPFHSPLTPFVFPSFSFPFPYSNPAPNPRPSP